MKTSRNSVAVAAAVAGLLAGTAARAKAAPSSAQWVETDAAKKAEKHACAGKNSCKGLGGCSSGDNGCAGKNSCKGKGGCATDGKMDPKKK